MNKFTKLLEDKENRKTYKVDVKIELTIEASNEGEASYLSDSILSSIKGISNYTINNIETKEGV
jgi:hypothetical protein